VCSASADYSRTSYCESVARATGIYVSEDVADVGRGSVVTHMKGAFMQRYDRDCVVQYEMKRLN